MDAADDGSPAPASSRTAEVKRRAPVACRRCRRMRSKCVHKTAKPPCDGCKEAGLTEADCVFPKRGQPDNDREYRHPRLRTEKSSKRDPNKLRQTILDAPIPHASVSPSKAVVGVDSWDCLPPVPEIVDAIHMFTRHYFQLGFIHKASFIDQLVSNPRSTSVFLLLGILSISARFTPSLIARYETAVNAAETFMERASAVALTELYKETNLERCQGFYLLGIAQQGSGYNDKSYINLGIAMRMAAFMRLHREETYALPPESSANVIVRAESARRTLWMLHSQDNLHSGPSSPVSLSEADITALLPSDEDDFNFGRQPISRAALEGTPPAIEDQSLAYDPHRSLFATLIQTHHLWGMVSRKAVRPTKSHHPWDPKSDFGAMKKKLDDWEQSLPSDHTWSPVLLKGYKMTGQGLAFLAVTTVTRLCNIIIRKAYLDNMINRDQAEPRARKFWADMSEELFFSVKGLFHQIDTHFSERSPDDGTGAQMAAFCVYSCGIMATYLCRYPKVCSDALSRDGPAMLSRTISILEESKKTWPLACRWLEGLKSFSAEKKGMIRGHEGSMADGRDPIPQVLYPPATQQPGPPTTPLDDKSKFRRQSMQQGGSPGPSGHILPGLQAMPLPDMLIDPSIRLPRPHPPLSAAQPLLSAAHPQLSSAHPQLPAAHPQLPTAHSQILPAPSPPEMPPQQHHAAHYQHPSQGRTNNLDLLVQASFDPHQGGHDPSGTGGYYEQPGAHMVTNDGFESELQFYIDGAPNLQTSVWGAGGMYGP